MDEWNPLMHPVPTNRGIIEGAREPRLRTPHEEQLDRTRELFSTPLGLAWQPYEARDLHEPTYQHGMTLDQVAYAEARKDLLRKLMRAAGLRMHA